MFSFRKRQEHIDEIPPLPTFSFGDSSYINTFTLTAVDCLQFNAFEKNFMTKMVPIRPLEGYATRCEGVLITEKKKLIEFAEWLLENLKE